MPVKSKRKWFETCLGQYLLEREQNYFDKTVADVFGYNAMQIGFPQYDFLRANRMPLQFCAGTEKGASVLAAPDFLPIETNSIDLVLMPHMLEFSANPHQILREVQRVLMLRAMSLFPASTRAACGVCEGYSGRRTTIFPGAAISLRYPRLKDWLTLLDFEITEDRLCCYAPPFSQEKWLKRFSFMETAGSRWWRFSGGVYFLTAVKRVHGMRVIKPEWKEVRARRKSMAPVAQKIKGAAETSEPRRAARSRTAGQGKE